MNERPRAGLYPEGASPRETDAPRLELPVEIMGLQGVEKEEFDALMFPAVIPYTGENYMRHLNAFFGLRETSLIAGEINTYLRLPPGDEKKALGEALQERMISIQRENIDKIVLAVEEKMLDEEGVPRNPNT